MKSVDVTLLIQIVNFFIAYWFLHTYVFVPSAKILEAEELQDKRMQKLTQESLEARDLAAASSKRRMLQIKQTLMGLVPERQSVFSFKFGNQKHKLLNENVVLSEQENQNIKKTISDAISKVEL